MCKLYQEKADKPEKEICILSFRCLRVDTYRCVWTIPYGFMEWTLLFRIIHRRFSQYSYLYQLYEKSEVLDVFKVFKAEVELQLGKHVKDI